MNSWTCSHTTKPHIISVGQGGDVLSTGTCCMIQKQSCPTCTFSQSHSPETLAGYRNWEWNMKKWLPGLWLEHWGNDVTLDKHRTHREAGNVMNFCQIYRIGDACTTLGWRYQGGSRMKGADLEVYELEMWISSHWCMDGPWSHVCGWRIVWGGWRKTLRRKPWGMWI